LGCRCFFGVVPTHTFELVVLELVCVVQRRDGAELGLDQIVAVARALGFSDDIVIVRAGSRNGESKGGLGERIWSRKATSVASLDIGEEGWREVHCVVVSAGSQGSRLSERNVVPGFPASTGRSAQRNGVGGGGSENVVCGILDPDVMAALTNVRRATSVEVDGIDSRRRIDSEVSANDDGTKVRRAINVGTSATIEADSRGLFPAFVSSLKYIYYYSL